MITKRLPKANRSELFIHLNDEAPRIGCGWRGIRVTQRGRKWVHVRDMHGNCAKFDVGLWAALERKARPVT